jgi:transposase
MSPPHPLPPSQRHRRRRRPHRPCQGRPALVPEVTPGASASAPAPRPLPRSGRSPRLQPEQRARHAARPHREAQVQTRCAQGPSLRPIAAAWGLKTKPVRGWVQTETLPLAHRGSRGAGTIAPSSPYLQTRLAEGGTNPSRVWRAMQAQGFPGPRSLVATWIPAHGHPSPGAPAPAPPQRPAARELAWRLCQDAEKQTAEDPLLRARLRPPPALGHVPELIQQGAARIRQPQVDALAPWLKACSASPVGERRNCADVLQRDAAAVKAALTLPGSSGPVEGHINRLTLSKRSGYGRMQLHLLRQRVLYDAA